MSTKARTMDPLNFKTNEELTQFFRSKKTEMSCMEQPQTFLRQLRDHELIPEDEYKKVMKTKHKQTRVTRVYEVLDWLETKRAENISRFWKCVFEDHILKQYPILRDMRDRLLDESSSGKLPENKETMEAKEGKGVKRRKTKDGNKAENLEETESSKEEEKSGTSKYWPPFKQSKTEENWLVVCGVKKGFLYRDKLARGEKCILADKLWFYPFEFEEYGGKKTCRNWKTSIRYQNKTLHRLIQAGHLTCGKFKPCRSRSNKRLRQELKNQAEASTSGSKSKRQLEEARESSAGGAAAHDRGDGENNPSQFRGNCLVVTCGSARGILYKDRFATGLLGKCIRLEDKWVTPVDFLKEDPTSAGCDWMNRILCLGMPLRHLLKQKVLRFHPFQCDCRLCTSKDQAMQDQNNDDVCFICDVPGCLLCCDQCPRAFHFECHIPAMNRNVDYRDKWICTYCVLKNTQGWRHPSKMTLQKALENPISARLLDCQYLLLCLYKEDKEKVFKSDSQRLASPKVQEPMWLDKITEKLQSKSYSTVGQFFSDVHLMFRNQGNCFAKLGTKLTSLFEEEFRKVFFIRP